MECCVLSDQVTVNDAGVKKEFNFILFYFILFFGGGGRGFTFNNKLNPYPSWIPYIRIRIFNIWTEQKGLWYGYTKDGF